MTPAPVILLEDLISPHPQQLSSSSRFFILAGGPRDKVMSHGGFFLTDAFALILHFHHTFSLIFILQRLLTLITVSACMLSCVRLFATLDCNAPGSSVHGIFQARILEWLVVVVFFF